MAERYTTGGRMKAVDSQGFGKRACLLLRPLCRLPGLRRSLVAQLTLATAMTLGVPVAVAFWAARSTGFGDQETATVVVAAAMLGLAGFAGVVHCLSEPIRQMIRMVRSYRVGDTLQPPAEVQYDEIGALVGETLQTLREANAHLSQRARRDVTTGALNRDGLDAELAFLLGRAEGQRQVVLVLIELRELGRWEMALGVDTVQSVRRVVVDRLRDTAPATGAVAALGPTWFAWAAAAPPDEVDERVSAVWERMRAPIDCGERALAPTCAMGLARASPGDTAVGLFHAAEAALSHARQKGESAFVEAADSSARLHDAASLGLALEEAIDRGSIEAHFQPRIDARRGTLASAEALARWEHAEHGRISPATFIPLAYSSGRIVALGRHMIDQAVAAVAEWRRRGRDLAVSINVDADHLTSGTLETDVVAALTRHHVPSAALELEITEASLLTDLEGASAQIVRLRERGIRLALDDFGTGYSSLGYLGRLPIDRVKIDRSFVAELASEEGRRIVRAIIDLARSLSMATTAEGVETKEQARQLSDLGCDELQGFLYGAAVPWDELAASDVDRVAAVSDAPGAMNGKG